MENQLPLIVENSPQLHTLRESPTNRLSLVGAGNLSALELLGAIIGLDKALIVLNTVETIGNLARADFYDLCATRGVKPKDIAALKAAVEIGRRAMVEENGDRPQITSPADLYAQCLDMGQLQQEQMRVILLDTRNCVIRTVTVYQGSVNTQMVRVSELLKDAIRSQAPAIALAHNHPSGDPDPSPEDAALTRQLDAAAKTMDITLLDHIVVGQGKFVSLKERGLL